MTKRKPGRPPKAAQWHILTLRLEPEIIETLDKLVEQVYEKQNLNVSRVDLIRQAVRQYCEREMSEVG